jgi:heat-inducible transcriptional repressor
MEELTDRQKELLKSIIEEYVATAEPVGSETIVGKFSLGVSPATVRNEMATLIKTGYLKQPHTSAGRIPSPQGLKFYIKELMKEQEVPVKDEVAIKENLWDNRFQMHRLLKEATRKLAEQSGTLSIAVTEEGDVFHSGSHRILDTPEFVDMDLTKTVLMLTDHTDLLNQILEKAVGNEPVHVLLGDDLGNEYLEYCGVVFSPFGAGKKNAGIIGVFGPSRMAYPRVVPTVRYFGDLLTDLVSSW